MKRAILISGIAVVAIAGTTLTAAAFGKGEHRGMHRMHGPQINFEQADTNSDGKLSKEELAAHAKARFDENDTDKNGTLSKDEMAGAIVKMAKQHAAKGAERMIEHRDQNGDGVLSYDEIGPGKRADKMFSRLDADNDGMISQEELQKMSEKRGMMRKHRKHMMQD